MTSVIHFGPDAGSARPECRAFVVVGRASGRSSCRASAARPGPAIGGPGALYTELTGAVSPSPAEIVLVLLATGAVATLGAVAVFRVSDRRAKDRGLFDQTTGS